MFPDIRKWIADVQSFAESNVNIVLIGNKCDLVDAKVIDTEAGKAVARDFGIAFYEVRMPFQISASQLVQQHAMRRTAAISFPYFFSGQAAS
jgi:GTPase SAR1 family protein